MFFKWPVFDTIPFLVEIVAQLFKMCQKILNLSHLEGRKKMKLGM